MTRPIYIEYEAAEVIVRVEGDLAVLVMETVTGRIAVSMRQTVFQGLYAQLKQALEP